VRPFTFTVTVELERECGKFMSRDEAIELLLAELEGSDPGSIDGGPDGDSIYNVVAWEVAS
jgi:hypothetical protein